jgi:outer membrane biosynthesis protein TonB
VPTPPAIVPSQPRPTTLALTPATGPHPESPAAAPVASSAASAPEGEVAALYSASDLNVDPPVLLHPQLRSEDVFRDTDGVESHLDIVVSAMGTVEQVRLTPPNSHLNDKMLLAAAKAWQFRPARRDGQPVRYRLRLRIPR